MPPKMTNDGPSESIAKRLILYRIKQRVSAALFEEVKEITDDELFGKDTFRFFAILFSLEDDAPRKKPSVYISETVNPIHFEFFELLDGFYFSVDWAHPQDKGSGKYYEITRIHE